MWRALYKGIVINVIIIFIIQGPVSVILPGLSS